MDAQVLRTAPLFRTKDQQMQQLETLKKEAADYDIVRIAWPDLHGIARGACVHRSNVPDLIQNGLGIASALLTLGPHCELALPEPVAGSMPNCTMRPVPGTLHHLPWCGGGKYKVAQVLGESVTVDGSPDQIHTRFIARKQLHQLEKLGYTLQSAWEAEFFVYDSQTKRPVFDHPDDHGLFAMYPYQQMFFEAQEQLANIGIQTQKFNAEYGKGQFEMNLDLESGIQSADKMFLFKESMKELIHDKGYDVTFMSVPYPGSGSNGLHFNHSLWNATGRNLFCDQKDGLSDLAKQWMAGLVKHAPALALLQCPTANCYRRLHQMLTPSTANWGSDNRSAAVRSKTVSPTQTYLENRMPSGAANPYLVVAATVAAGLDGLLNKLELPPEADPKAVVLPTTMEEAITALEEDTLIKEALGPAFVESYLTAKKVVELGAFKDHDMKKEIDEELGKERDMYFTNV